MSRAPIHSLLLALASALPCLAQTPAEDGKWTSAFALPLPAIHAVLLPPDGRLLLYSYVIQGGQGTECWTLDPDTLALANYPLGTNVFCGGHNHLVDGDVLVVGGVAGHFNTGLDKSYVFSEAAGGFSEVGSMAKGRWYPSITKLADGRFTAMAGFDIGGQDNPLVEIFDPVLQRWSVLPGADKQLPLYPMAFLIPTGEVLVAGPQRDTEALDVSSGKWRSISKTARGHHEGCAVLLPPYPDRVMVIGGHNVAEDRTFKGCEILDLSDVNPQWRKTTPMRRRRQHHNACLLPNGTVLVIGGLQVEPGVDTRSTSPPFHRGEAVREAEVFDPLTETWKLLAAQARPRLYHSTGILLRDGRVLTAGGEQEPSAEIYSPPYLFHGPRPSLRGLPAATTYGAAFSVQSDQADRIVSACLISPGAVTHSFCQSQRFVALDVQSGGSGSAVVTMPASATVAPPGYYMLFVVNDVGVPSVGEFFQLK